MAILFLSLLAALVLGALCAMVLDLARITARRIDGRRIRRESKRGWDWPSFERDLAHFTRQRATHAAQRRR